MAIRLLYGTQPYRARGLHVGERESQRLTCLSSPGSLLQDSHQAGGKDPAAVVVGKLSGLLNVKPFKRVRTLFVEALRRGGLEIARTKALVRALED